MTKEYRNEDKKLHRVNGPAFEWSDRDYTWWYNGEVHRYYGPARCWHWLDGNEYWIFGEQVE